RGSRDLVRDQIAPGAPLGADLAHPPPGGRDTRQPQLRDRWSRVSVDRRGHYMPPAAHPCAAVASALGPRLLRHAPGRQLRPKHRREGHVGIVPAESVSTVTPCPPPNASASPPRPDSPTTTP